MKAIVIALVVLLAGCTGRQIQLDPQYAPLTTVAEATDKIMPAHVVTTIYSTSFVGDLKAFEADWPEGVGRDAILSHERMHSLRQLQDPSFLIRYATESSYRWEEEKLGYAEEIKKFRAAGMYIDVEGYAQILSGDTYTIAGTPMVSYEKAKAWVQSQILTPQCPVCEQLGRSIRDQ